MNRPVRSPRISVGLECAAALAPAGNTTLGAGGREGGRGLRRRWLAAEQVLGEGMGGTNVDVTSPPSIVVGGVGGHGHGEPVGAPL